MGVILDITPQPSANKRMQLSFICNNTHNDTRIPLSLLVTENAVDDEGEDLRLAEQSLRKLRCSSFSSQPSTCTLSSSSSPTETEFGSDASQRDASQRDGIFLGSAVAGITSHKHANKEEDHSSWHVASFSHRGRRPSSPRWHHSNGETRSGSPSYRVGKSRNHSNSKKRHLHLPTTHPLLTAQARAPSPCTTQDLCSPASSTISIGDTVSIQRKAPHLPYHEWEVHFILYLRDINPLPVSADTAFKKELWKEITRHFDECMTDPLRKRKEERALHSRYYREQLVPRRDCRGKIVRDHADKVVMRKLGIRERSGIVGIFWQQYLSVITRCPDMIASEGYRSFVSEQHRREAQRIVEERRVTGLILPGARKCSQAPRDERPIWEQAFDPEVQSDKALRGEIVRFQTRWSIEPPERRPMPWFYREGDEYPGWYVSEDVDFPQEYYDLLGRLRADGWDIDGYYAGRDGRKGNGRDGA